MLVYVLTFVCNNFDCLVGVYSTKEKALEAREVYNGRCGVGDYTFINEMVLDSTKDYRYYT
jgi:hypothetical protein